MSITKIENALISVSNKTGLAELAKALVGAGAKIYSTGGTARHIREAGCEVIDIATYTGFPEMMDGRLKTLHPKVFGGILCRHNRETDMQAIRELGIERFDLVVVNLYPFEQTVSQACVTVEEAVEQIDIGGPSLVRAAAKNHAFTAVCTSPEQYPAVADELESQQGTSLDLRRKLAAEAFAHTAAYDIAITAFFASNVVPKDRAATESSTAAAGADPPEFPQTQDLHLELAQTLRYGENPHQVAALYRNPQEAGANLLSAEQLNGKELSYNNLLDLDSAMAIARCVEEPAAAVIKHNNPCGAATAETLAEAVEAALSGDPVSAFGSVIGVNRSVDAATAEVLVKPGQFIEAIVAPAFDDAAIEVLTTKPKWKTNVRLMKVGDLSADRPATQLRWIEGGILVQGTDFATQPTGEWHTVTDYRPTDEQFAALQFAWAMVRHVKSNAIALANGTTLVGVGAGQMSRVDSVEIAIKKAGDRAQGAVLASDAFFPFPDSIHAAADAGIAAIIQPGGSVKDEEVIAACNERKLPMLFTGQRHFKH